MSVDSHVLGTSTAVGGAAAIAAQSSNHKLLIGLAVGLITLIILGFIARKLAKRNHDDN